MSAEVFRQWMCVCPWCGGDDFCVSEKNERYHCFKCQENGEMGNHKLRNMCSLLKVNRIGSGVSDAHIKLVHTDEHVLSTLGAED